MNRVAAVNRETAETKIALQLNLDGAGNGAIDSGIGFFDHMLNLMVVHGQLDLDLRCDGDLEVDGHHSVEDIGIALGAVAGYAQSRDVPKARVIFCDAKAYDMGYLSPQDIAGKVEVIGRGGTVLQPAVDLLENARDFPKDGAVLIITDGYIERDLKVKRQHAFLIPQGHILPFRPTGKVFYYHK